MFGWCGNLFGSVSTPDLVRRPQQGRTPCRNAGAKLAMLALLHSPDHGTGIVLAKLGWIA